MKARLADTVNISNGRLGHFTKHTDGKSEKRNVAHAGAGFARNKLVTLAF